MIVFLSKYNIVAPHREFELVIRPIPHGTHVSAQNITFEDLNSVACPNLMEMIGPKGSVRTVLSELS